MCKNLVRGMGRYVGTLIGVAVTALLVLAIGGCAHTGEASLTSGIAHDARSANGVSGHETTGSQRSATAAGATAARPATSTETAGSAAAESRRVAPEPESPQPYKMLFVGASITAGIGASSTAASFPYVLGDEVQKVVGPVQENVVATPGAPVRVALQWPLPAGQDLVVVHMATNDFLQGTPVMEYQSELLTLLRRIRAESPHATLVCLGAWASPDQLNAEQEGPAAYNNADQADCQAVGGSYIPLQSFFGQRRLHDPMPLGASPELRSVLGVYDLGGRTVAFHPSDAGENAIAKAIYGALERNDSLPPEDVYGHNV